MGKDIPIIFSSPMVRALLEGRKTQTRRILKNVPPPPDMSVHPAHRPRHSAPYLDAYCGAFICEENPRGMSSSWCWWTRDDRACDLFNVRYAPGDRLWVREGWKPHSIYAHMKPREMPKANIFYLADEKYEPSNVRGLPSIHMPRWASRLTLLVTDVKIERAQSISEDDAKAEGAIKAYFSEDTGNWFENSNGTHVCGFAGLWAHINGADAWDQNPFVVALTFRVIKANIDVPEARAAA